MMTRKDYKFVAATLNDVMDNLHPAVYAELVAAFSNYMAEDNERFNEDMFEEACYAERDI